MHRVKADFFLMTLFIILFILLASGLIWVLKFYHEEELMKYVLYFLAGIFASFLVIFYQALIEHRYHMCMRYGTVKKGLAENIYEMPALSKSLFVNHFLTVSYEAEDGSTRESCILVTCEVAHSYTIGSEVYVNVCGRYAAL